MPNREKDATLDFVTNQIDCGFDPKFMVTYHYRHPSEFGWRVVENVDSTSSRWGFKSTKSLWNEVPSYNYYVKRRGCEDCIIQDASQVKNVMLKYFWGIKRPNQTWKCKYPPMLFFHEMGKIKLQYCRYLARCLRSRSWRRCRIVISHSRFLRCCGRTFDFTADC